MAYTIHLFVNYTTVGTVTVTKSNGTKTTHPYNQGQSQDITGLTGTTKLTASGTVKQWRYREGSTSSTLQGKNSSTFSYKPSKSSITDVWITPVSDGWILQDNDSKFVDMDLGDSLTLSDSSANAGDIYRYKVSFTNEGAGSLDPAIIKVMNSSSSSTYAGYWWWTEAEDFDLVNGLPEGYDTSDAYAMRTTEEMSIDADTDYYLWARAKDVTSKLGSLSVTITAPTGWSISTTVAGGTIDADEIYNPSSFSISAGKIRRYKIKFSFSGDVTFETTGSSDTYGYLSETDVLDPNIGGPEEYLAKNDDSGDGDNFSFTESVKADVQYYLWIRPRYFDETVTSTKVKITPDQTTWIVDGSPTDLGTLSKNYTSSSTTLKARYIRLYKVKFANSGSVRFYTTGGSDTVGSLSLVTQINLETGNFISPLQLVDYRDNATGRNFSFSFDNVNPSITYYILVRNYSIEESSTFQLHVDVNEEETVWDVIDEESFLNTVGESQHSTRWVEATLDRYTISFAYAGTAQFMTDRNTEVLGFLSTGTGFNSETGKPNDGLISSSFGVQGGNYTTQVEPGKTYYYWLRGATEDSTGSYTFTLLAPGEPIIETGTGVHVYRDGWKTATAYIYDNGWKPISIGLYNNGWKT